MATPTPLPGPLAVMDTVISSGEGPLFGVASTEEARWTAWNAAQTAWLDSKRRRSGRENTVHAYAMAVRQFFSWAGCPPWEVSPLLAQEWVRELAASGRSEATINVKLAALGSLYDYVQRRYVMQTSDGRVVSLWPADRMNPFQTVERVKVSPYGRAAFPTTDELQQILGAINRSCLVGARDFALLFTIATTCRRFSEIINLRWGDLRELETGDFAFRYLYKGGKEKADVLPRACYEAICAYLVASGRDPSTMQEEDTVFVALYPDRVLRLMPDFSADENAPLTNKSANRVIKKYARRAGVDSSKAHIHGLRHAGLRLRVKQMKASGQGIDYIEIMEKAGHSSLAVTQIYIQEVLEDPDDPGGAAAAAALLPKPGQRRRRKKAVSSAQDKLPGM